MQTSSERARCTLDGLSVGDAFGERAFTAVEFVARRTLPEGMWRWTDDTAMAVSIVETLEAHGTIDQDDLAQRFAARFAREPNRGYGGGAVELLEAIGAGGAWREQAGALFDGQGSYGNGAAMRVAPVGAWFATEPEVAADQARRSAAVTHAHVEAREGAAAIALTTAWLWMPSPPAADEILGNLVGALAPCETRERIAA
ncbi:MAG: ADP-ribosylglycohydrolase family protein, partial [Myxococcota bacterium]